MTAPDPHAACTAERAALAEERDWFKAEMEHLMFAASTNLARMVAAEALAARTEDDLQRMEIAQAACREMVRDALAGLESLVDDPRDPAIRRLLRRMRAACRPDTVRQCPSDAPQRESGRPGA